MQIQGPLQQNQTFGKELKLFNFKLPKKTITLCERTTGLTYKELTTLPIDKAKILMKQRETLKETSKLKQWCINKYREICEKLGLV